MTGASARRLASARLEVVTGTRTRTLLRVALLAVLAVASVAASVRVLSDHATTVTERGRLRQENVALRTGLARLEAELRLERATRAELERQLADLERAAGERDRQQAFVDAQRRRGPTAAR